MCHINRSIRTGYRTSPEWPWPALIPYGMVSRLVMVHTENNFCTPKVNEESESRWIIRFCFIKLEENHFTHFTRRLNRDRRESEIMIDYLSKKYNYMLQNGGKYPSLNHHRLLSQDRRTLLVRKTGQREADFRSQIRTKLFNIEPYPIIDHYNN